MVHSAGSKRQPAATSRSRVHYFVEVALRLDGLAALPEDNRVSSAWKSITMSEAAALVDYGPDWWRHLSTGYSYFLEQAYGGAWAPAVDPTLSFEQCITRMEQIARDLREFSPSDRGLVRDGMTCARAYWRSTQPGGGC